MNVVTWQNLNELEKKQALSRPLLSQQSDVIEVAKNIISEVKTLGDEAIFQYTEQFDGVRLDELSSTADRMDCDDDTLNAIKQAITNIRMYHQAIKPQTISCKTAEGVELEKVYKPIKRVGLYVPGGSAPLVSSLLMLAIPAQVAGCAMKVVCTPCNKQGRIDPLLLTAAKLCGIDKVYSIGGAQAIAAMAYGTKSIPKVDKIFGPGNRYVTAAKTLVAQDPQATSIDMPAGPSEVMVLADKKANPDFVAADLLSQAEHGVDSQSMLVTTSEYLCTAVHSSLERQSQQLSRRDIIEQSLNHSRLILCSNEEQMIDIANRYAAEHLIINTKNADTLVTQITAAGSIFVGPWAAEAMGDYITGSNHVLPTYGCASKYSGLATSDFMNAVSIQKISQQGIQSMGQHAIKLAMLEGLDAHALAIRVREKTLCG